MSSLSRTFAILDLFTPHKMVWGSEAISEALGYSRPTGYRYIRELTETGLLVKMGPGTYSLGPRIVEWDYLIRRADPMLTAGLPAIRDLVAQTGFDVNLVGIYGDQIITTHQEPGTDRLPLSFSRGRPFPLLRGAVSRVIIPHFPRARLKRLYEQYATEASELGYGDTWDEFRKHCARVKREGFSVSRGELDPGMAGVAVPVFGGLDRILGCVVAAMTCERLELTRIDVLVVMLREIATAIERSITHPKTIYLSLVPQKAAG